MSYWHKIEASHALLVLLRRGVVTHEGLPSRPRTAIIDVKGLQGSRAEKPADC